MATIKFFSGGNLPLEMHKVRIVQKLTLPPIEYRLKAMNEASNNTFLSQNADVFMDMLTDSGVNAMSDQQLAAMMVSDDSYAGSATYTRLEAKLRELFGMHWILPAHQGRACENILSQTFVRPGKIVPMNYHFTTTKAHITLNGGVVEEYVKEEGLEVTSNLPFKVAVPEPQAGRGSHLCRRAGDPALPLRASQTGIRLAGKARREVPRGLRRQPVDRNMGERPPPHSWRAAGNPVCGWCFLDFPWKAHEQLFEPKQAVSVSPTYKGIRQRLLWRATGGTYPEEWNQSPG